MSGAEGAATIVRRITTAVGVLDLRSSGHDDLVPAPFRKFASKDLATSMVRDAAALYALFANEESDG